MENAVSTNLGILESGYFFLKSGNFEIWDKSTGYETGRKNSVRDVREWCVLKSCTSISVIVSWVVSPIQQGGGFSGGERSLVLQFRLSSSSSVALVIALSQQDVQKQKRLLSRNIPPAYSGMLRVAHRAREVNEYACSEKSMNIFFRKFLKI